MALDAALLDRLGRLHAKLIDLSLDRVTTLLAKLGDPQRHLPPVVHVAGTNGKGSLVAYLAAISEAAGLRAHVYISPHLVRFNERIRLAGREIADAPLAALLDRVEQANAGQPITFFEITTAAGLLAFAESPADLVLLEVGMGGRLDATNVVPRPAITAIQPVSLDHEQFLGSSVAAIAAEKAGILKPGVPAVIGPQTAAAAAVIAARAGELQAPLTRHGVEFGAVATAGGFTFTGPGGAAEFPAPGLIGRHQIDNAGVAVACARLLGRQFAIDDAAIAAGLTGVRWPARLQRLTQGPLVRLLPSEGELWLDGGHNPGAGTALADTLGGWGDQPLRLVLGMLANKDAVGYLAPLAPHLNEIWTVPVPGDTPAHTPEALAAAAAGLGLRAHIAGDPAAALRAMAGRAPVGRVLIAGSLHLAGLVLAANH